MYLDFINNYGILILTLIYILINFYYKNIVNIVIFLVIYIVLMNFIDKINAIFIAYLCSICYGIVKNFHLVENFKAYINEVPIENNKHIKNIINHDLISISDNDKNANANANANVNRNRNKNTDANANRNRNKNANANVNRNINKNANVNRNKNTNANANVNRNKNVLNQKNIETLVSENLINTFINKLKSEDNLLIKKDKKNLYDLKPIKNNLSNNKIKIMARKAKNGDNFIFKPIIISNDNFIVHGHHKWYTKKSLIENNLSGSTNMKLYDENVNVIIIDYNIKKLIQKLQDYKINFNKKNLNNSLLNVNKINKGNQLIQTLKKNINDLDRFYQDFNNINLV